MNHRLNTLSLSFVEHKPKINVKSLNIKEQSFNYVGLRRTKKIHKKIFLYGVVLKCNNATYFMLNPTSDETTKSN